MKKYIFGKLRWESDQERPYFETNDGIIVENIDISKKPDVPREKYIQVFLDQNILIDWKHDYRVASEPAPSHRIIALTRISKPGSPPSDNKRRRHVKSATSVQDELNYIGRGKLTYEVHPVFFETDSSITLRGFDWDSLEEYLESEYPDIPFTHFHIVGGYHDICGRAFMNGNRAMTSGDPNCGSDTIKHEHGHNEGLHHAGTESAEYGERDVLMGSGGARRGLNAPHRYVLGVVDENHVAEIEKGDARKLYIVDSEMDDLSTPVNAHQLAIARLSRTEDIRRLAVSVHKGQIDIHKPAFENSTEFFKTIRLGELNEGDSFSVAGVIITFVKNHESICAKEVLIENNTTPDTQVENDDFPTFPIPDEVYTFDGSSGIWHNPAWEMQGLHVRYMPERNEIYVLWLSHTFGGDQWWAQGVLSVSNDVASGEIHTGEDAEVIGYATLFFNSDNEAVFRVSEYDKRNWVLPLERLSSRDEQSGLNGFFALGNKQGIHFETTTRNKKVGYWVGEKEPARPWTTKKDPFWRVLIENLEGDIIIYDVENGYPMVSGREVTAIPKGIVHSIIERSPDSGEHSQIELEYDGQEHTFPLMKLA